MKLQIWTMPRAQAEPGSSGGLLGGREVPLTDRTIPTQRRLSKKEFVKHLLSRRLCKHGPAEYIKAQPQKRAGDSIKNGGFCLDRPSPYSWGETAVRLAAVDGLRRS